MLHEILTFVQTAPNQDAGMAVFLLIALALCVVASVANSIASAFKRK